MSHVVTLIVGDGIGEEVVLACKKVVEATQVKIKWDPQNAGLGAFEKEGTSLPEATVESIRQNKVALKGPTTTPIGSGHRSVNVQIRQALKLFACVRPVKTVPGVTVPFTDLDLVIVRENTEGLYIGIEDVKSEDEVVSHKVVTRAASERIARFAFKLASELGRKRVTAVHKANILKKGDGLFLKCALETSRQFASIGFDDVIIDALCMKLVTNPTQFDVLLLPNLYGDIVSDLCAGLVGGLGLVPGANFGADAAVFEAVHGSAPDIAGQGKANPTAMIKSAVMMLEHLGEKKAARQIGQSIHSVLKEGKIRTADLGGTASTEEFAQAVISEFA